MPPFVRFYIRHVLIGFAIAAVFVGLLLWLDVARLRTLIAGSDVGALALFMLWAFHGIVFSGVQFGISVMRLAEDDTTGGGKRDTLPAGAALPVKVESGGTTRQP